MFLYYKLRATFLSYYLLAIAASIIILSGVGSANIMFISMGGNEGTAIEMILVTLASMAFLSAALAQLKPVYVFNFFFWGLLFQISFMVLKTSIGF
jgi:hypothetical protein